MNILDVNLVPGTAELIVPVGCRGKRLKKVLAEHGLHTSRNRENVRTNVRECEELHKRLQLAAFRIKQTR